MNLKPQPDKPTVALPNPPTWGVLAQDGEPVSSMRFECAVASYSYPYHRLDRWIFHPGDPERLIVQAGKDTITICGRELVSVRDALENGRLRVLRSAGERYLLTKTGTVIADICFADS